MLEPDDRGLGQIRDAADRQQDAGRVTPAERGTVHVRDLDRRDLVFVCVWDRPRDELVVVTLWEEGEDPEVPKRFTDALRRR